jgi:glycine/D-amino acid oxidase-like deaminating enzyme
LYPYWWDSEGVRPGRWTAGSGSSGAEQSALPSRVDVAIVGAGYTGLSAARELARGGASVVAIERGQAGWGASSRNGGQVLTGLKLGPMALVARFGESRARQLFEISLESIAALESLMVAEAMNCEYERHGHIEAASKPAHFEVFRAEQTLLARVFAHRVELVTRHDQRVELDSERYFGLMVDERSAGINPARLVEELIAAACRTGVTLAEATRVNRLDRTGRGWEVVTNRGIVEAGEVLVATNAYADKAAPWLQRRFVPIGSYAIATEPLAPTVAVHLIPNRRMVFDSKHFLHFFRLTRDRRLLFGGRAEFGRATQETTRRCAEILRQEMTAVFPSLASVSIDYAWSGNVAFSRDQMPRAGRLNGAYYAGGYAGHGIAMSIYLGALIARRIAGESVAHPLIDDRFPTIPLYRGTPWFLPLVGAYYKVRDWLE